MTWQPFGWSPPARTIANGQIRWTPGIGFVIGTALWRQAPFPA